MALFNYQDSLRLALTAEKRYYEDDNPIMSDSAYDALIRQLKEYEEAHPEEKCSISPTTRVGGAPTSSFEKVNFPVKMLSLKNSFTDTEVFSFMENTKTGNVGYVVQPKLDGLTLVLWYDGGLLQRAATRGNGEVGEDVTANAMYVLGIPKQVPETEAFMVRGEVVMHKDDFKRLNAEREKAGKPLFANERNVAAGSVRQKDAAITASRKLHFYAYDIPGSEAFTTEGEMLAYLVEQGFTIPRSYNVSTTDEYLPTVLMARVNDIKRYEDRLDYAIDGAVIKTNSRGACRKRLGESTHDPNWAVAFKFTPVSSITKLLAVTWQMGRTGKLTPVAVLEPVDLCGTTVEHASLHNVEYLRELQPHIGDMVSVYKAAEIIPQIDCVVESMGGDPVIIPALCSECGSELITDGPNLKCNNPDCLAKVKAELRYFVSRQNMDIQQLGSAIVDELVEAGKVRTPADLYKLENKDLLIPGMVAANKAASLMYSIEHSKDQPFYRVLASLGIDQVSITTAKALASRYGSMDALNKASVEDLATVEGIAGITASVIRHSLHSPKKQALIQALTEAGLNMVAEEAQKAGTELEGKTFVITGTLSKSRDLIKKLIEDHSGKVLGSITTHTDYLIAGTGGGSKRARADKLNVPIINEEQLMEMLK